MPEAHRERDRSWRWATLILGAILVSSLFFTVHPWYDPTNDGSMYIAAARSIVRGEGYSYLGQAFTIRPPGFACSLAPLLWARGTDFWALNLWVSTWGALGILAYHRLLRARLGAWLGMLVALLLWFNPGYQRLCNQVMSDVPGWTALVVSLLVAARVRAAPSAARSLALGGLLGLGALMRSGNLLLVPALCLAEFCCAAREGREAWRRALKHLAAVGLGVVIVLVPWSIRNALRAAPPPADQTLLYSYSSGMWHTDMGDPRSPRVPLSEVVARFPKQTAKLLHTLGTRLGDGAAAPWTTPLALLLLAALFTALLRRGRAEEWFALGTLGVVAFYFGYAGRLLLPVFAFAVAALVELAREGITRLAGARIGTSAAVLLVLAWIVLDWHPRADWERIEELHSQYQRTAANTSARLGADVHLGAYRGWHHAVFLDRPVYSFEQACARAGGPGKETAIEATVTRYGIEALLLSELGLPEVVQREERAFAAAVAHRYGVADRGLVSVR